MDIGIKIEEQKDQAIVYLSGEVDVYTSPQIKEKLFPLVEKPHLKVFIDLEKVNYMDSTGLGIIIGALKMTKENGSQLILQNANERIERLFNITGLTEIVEIHPEEA